jgi:hypothetical protein
MDQSSPFQKPLMRDLRQWQWSLLQVPLALAARSIVAPAPIVKQVA